MKSVTRKEKIFSKSSKDSTRVLRIGLSILLLAVLWLLVAPKVKSDTPTLKAPPDVQRRLDAVEAYKKDKSKNTFEYETEMVPPPLDGGKDWSPNQVKEESSQQ